MKIVFTEDVIYGYATGAPWADGGAERYQWLLARALAAAGWSVTVGVRAALEAGNRKKIDGVEFVGIGTQQVLSAWSRFLKTERPAWWYWATASHLWGPAVEIAKLVGVRTIFSSQFDTDVIPDHALSWRRRWWPLYAWGLIRTDKIFVQHAEQRARLKPTWRRKSSIVPGIVAQNNGNYTSHASRDFYVAWVGMLRQPKRPDLLIDIARRLPDIRFVVCGGTTHHRTPPGYGERLVEQMSRLPNIKFFGKVTPNEALQVIAQASILLSTSEMEGFPSVFLEAWSAGTPVVSLTIDPDEVIKRRVLGAVSGSVEAAVTDINALMSSLQQREEIGLRSRAYVAENHSDGAVVKVFEQAIQTS